MGEIIPLILMDVMGIKDAITMIVVSEIKERIDAELIGCGSGSGSTGESKLLGLKSIMQEQTLELLVRDVFNVLQICKQLISTLTPNCNKTEQDQELSKEEVWYDTFTDLKEDEPEKLSSGENLVVASTNAVTSIEGKMADENHNLNKPSPFKDAVKAAESDESACHNTATTSATKIVSQEDAITDEPAMNENDDDDVAAFQTTAQPVQEWDKLGHLVTPTKRSCVTQFFRTVFKPFSACFRCVRLD